VGFDKSVLEVMQDAMYQLENNFYFYLSIGLSKEFKLWTHLPYNADLVL
jgi:hypothetical protein